MPVLNDSELRELHEAILKTELVRSREALMAGIDSAFVAGIARQDIPRDQLLCDLDQLNKVDVLADGNIPLETWLANAAFLAGLRPESATFVRFRERVAHARVSPPPRPPRVRAALSRTDLLLRAGPASLRSRPARSLGAVLAAVAVLGITSGFLLRHLALRGDVVKPLLEAHDPSAAPSIAAAAGSTTSSARVPSADVPASAGSTAPSPTESWSCPKGTALIPAGTFTMGSADDLTNKPHDVKLGAYCIDLTEVTVAAYRRCATEARGAITCSAAPTTVHWSGLSADDALSPSTFCNAARSDSDAHPINCVDWDHANTYCHWAGGRLPKEAEWERAARGDDGRTYPWGDASPGPTLVNVCGSECRELGIRLGKPAWRIMYEANDGWETTAPVGTFPGGASPYGLLDMAGNVWEWVDSCARYRGPGSPAPDAGGPGDKAPVDEDRCVNRGGGWHNDAPLHVSTAFRYRNGRTDRLNGLGFRCAREASRKP
jgi:formylglycine-generating enzyme required for sulfatase activity